MKISEVKNVGWPLSLLRAVFPEDNIEYLPPGIEETVDYALSSLTERQRLIIVSRYKKAHTYKEIGLELSVTGSAVAHAESAALISFRTAFYMRILTQRLQKISSKRQSPMISEGQREQLAFLVGRENADVILRYEFEIGTIELSSTKLSPRSLNALKSAGINTLTELCKKPSIK